VVTRPRPGRGRPGSANTFPSPLPRNTTKISLLKASYIFEIYEAKTAKPLGRFTVPGDEACPGSVKADDRTFIGQAPDAAKLSKALRPYTERTADQAVLQQLADLPEHAHEMRLRTVRAATSMSGSGGSTSS
jgi:hypothetical protein